MQDVPSTSQEGVPSTTGAAVRSGPLAKPGAMIMGVGGSIGGRSIQGVRTAQLLPGAGQLEGLQRVTESCVVIGRTYREHAGMMALVHTAPLARQVEQEGFMTASSFSLECRGMWSPPSNLGTLQRHKVLLQSEAGETVEWELGALRTHSILYHILLTHLHIWLVVQTHAPTRTMKCLWAVHSTWCPQRSPWL